MSVATDEGDSGFDVCVLSVDSRYGFGANLQRTRYSYRSPAVARLFAERFARQMYDEGFDSIIRGVFVEDKDYQWKTVGSYFDVQARQHHLGHAEA